MEVVIFFALMALAFYTSVKSGVLTEMALDKVSPPCYRKPVYGPNGIEPPSYLFGKIAGYFIGMMGFLICSVAAGPYGPLWGLLASAFAFPTFAFTIFAYVRISEAISDWRNGRCVFC